MVTKKIAYATASILALSSLGSALAQVDADVDTESELRDVTETDVIVVQGIRQSITEGIEVKRDATQIVDSLVAQDIGKFPDVNVVESLQRITGIQVTDRAGGEVSAISIRGLNDVTTTLNGRNIFTASGRQFSLPDIPANLVGRLDVYKTRAADQIESGIAGQVNVLTRRPFDFDEPFTVSAYARGAYHEQRETFDPNVSALASARWETGIGDVGLLGNVSFVRTRFRDQSVTPGAVVPFVTEDDLPPGYGPLNRIFDTITSDDDPYVWTPGLNRGLPYEPGSVLPFPPDGGEFPYYLSRDAVFQSDFYGDRERPAVFVAGQWSPAEGQEYTAEFFYNGFRNQTFNSLHFLFVDSPALNADGSVPDFTLLDGTNIISQRDVNLPFSFNSGDYTKAQTDSFVYALNGKWENGENFAMEADLSYQDSEFETEFLAQRTNRVFEQAFFDVNNGDGIASFGYTDAETLTDPAAWNIGEIFDNADRDTGTAWQLTIDGDYDLDPSGDGFLERISFGIRLEDRKATERFRQRTSAPLDQPLSSLPSEAFFTNEDFFDGRSDVPTSWVLPDGDYLADNADFIRGLYGLSTSEDLTVDTSFEIEEKTYSAYAMLEYEDDFLGGTISGQAGVRFVRFDTDTTFFEVQLPGMPSTDGSSSIQDALPSFTVNYDVLEDVRLRFNYGETIRRPTFGDLNPTRIYNRDLSGVGYGTATGGNPDLRPVTSKNLDVAAEWYFQPGSALFATFFRREIDGLVVPFRFPVIADIPGLNTNTFIVSAPANASDGVLKGVEVGLTYFPEELPGLLDGFGFQGSLTYLDSTQNVPDTNLAGEVIGQRESGFFGVSDISFNTTLAYENSGLGARLSYVWRDDFLQRNEAALFANPLGVYRDAESSLDLQLSYDITDNATITLDAVNLTDELQQEYYQFEDAGGPDIYNFGSVIFSRTVAVGVRVGF